MRALSALAIAILVNACSEQPTTPAQPDATAALAGGTAPAGPAAPAGEEAAFIVTSAAVYRLPDEKAVDPKTNKPERAFAYLQRGESISALKQEGDWTQIKTNDDKVGWTKNANVLLAEGINLATVIDEVKTFSQPGFTYLVAGKTITPGSVLFVSKTKDTFSEVNYVGAYKTWVLNDKLIVDAREVEAARLVSRAKSLEKGNEGKSGKDKEENDKKIKETWDLAREQFGDTRLMTALNAAVPAPADAPTEAAAAPAETH